MTTYYYLKIYIAHIESGNMLISEILKIDPINSASGDLWVHSILERDEDPYKNGVSFYLNLIESNWSELRKIGLNKGDFTIWLDFHFMGELNYEFDSEIMTKLSRSGIKLCITAIDK